VGLGKEKFEEKGTVERRASQKRVSSPSRLPLRKNVGAVDCTPGMTEGSESGTLRRLIGEERKGTVMTETRGEELRGENKESKLFNAKGKEGR